MLAAALDDAGIVMWRAFVYDPAIDADPPSGRIDFTSPLDGQFADNVILQVKHGPLIFSIANRIIR